MPRCGSQIVLCDLPVRFDTYVGCSHSCRYCFASRKSDITKIKAGESIESLRRFIRGERTVETRVFDWNIPLHWGGMSDPFQPVEKIKKYSKSALCVFADTGYPFAVSTKNKLIADDEYLDVLKHCNSVVQFSACSSRFDRIEKGASSFEERLRAAEKIAKFTRVNIRVQPYIPSIFKDILSIIPRLANIGVYGLIIEGMKYTKGPDNVPLVRVAGDFCYPVSMLLPQFRAIRDVCHKAGLRFYCGENRLRVMGDSLCCCGVEGLGWKTNTANLNHLLFQPDTVFFSSAMEREGTCGVFGAIHQTTLFSKNSKHLSFKDQMLEEAKNPISFLEAPRDFSAKESETLRLALNRVLHNAGKTRRDIDRHLGTNGMAGHYFGKSQWLLPTEAAWNKMREILPALGDINSFLSNYGIKAGGSRVPHLITKA